MQPAQLPHDIIAGAQVQMVGIAQHHLTFQFLQVKGGNTALDGRSRCYIHKGRGLHRAVYRGKFRTAGRPFGFYQLIHHFSFPANVTVTISGGLKSRRPMLPRPNPRLKIIVLSSI